MANVAASFQEQNAGENDLHIYYVNPSHYPLGPIETDLI